MDGGNHTPAFTKAARTPEAHKACFNVSKALAATGLRVLTDDEFFAQVSLSHIYKLNCYMGTLQVLSSFEADKSARE